MAISVDTERLGMDRSYALELLAGERANPVVAHCLAHIGEKFTLEFVHSDDKLRQYGFRYCLAAIGWRSLPGIRMHFGHSRSLSDEDLGHVAHVLRRICGENIASAQQEPRTSNGCFHC